MKESPIFIPTGAAVDRKTYETLVWLLQHTQKFPKSQRFVMAKRMEEAVLDLQDQLLTATKGGNAVDALAAADFHLARLKVYNRLSKDLSLMAFNTTGAIGHRQYEYLAKDLDEIGRLLGGWQRRLTRSSPSDEG